MARRRARLLSPFAAFAAAGWCVGSGGVGLGAAAAFVPAPLRPGGGAGAGGSIAASSSRSFVPSPSSRRRLFPFDRRDEDGVDGGEGGRRPASKPPPSASPAAASEASQRRLREERLASIEAGEARRQARVAEDKFPYLFLFALQFLPLLGTDRIESVIYFFGVAVTTVYLGGRQEVIDAPERVSRDSAAFAPIFASLSIGGLYLLLKAGIDVTVAYAVGVTVFGALAVSDISVPILRNAFPSVDFASAEVPVPKAVADKLDLDRPALPLDGLVTLGLGIACTVAYWAPAAMEQKFLVSNAIAWALGMVSLGAISLGSFQTGTILLAGLFCYDVFWVFGTDVMMTVATKVEAPVKFLYTAPPSDVPKSYPFSVLGLGDVVIPGLFVRLMSKADAVLRPRNLSYFNVATGAYAAGLLACFGVNEIFHNGQPALLYLDPSLVGGTLACAAVNGQVPDLWNFKEEEEEGTEGEG